MTDRQVILFPIAAPAVGHAVVFGEDLGHLQGDLARGLTIDLARILDTWQGVSTGSSWMLMRLDGAADLMWTVHESLLAPEGIKWLAEKQPDAEFVLTGRLRLEDKLSWEILLFRADDGSQLLSRKIERPLFEIAAAVEEILEDLVTQLVPPGGRASWALDTTSGEAYVHYCVGLGHVKCLELGLESDGDLAYHHLTLALNADPSFHAAAEAIVRLTQLIMDGEAKGVTMLTARRALDALIDAGHATPKMLRQRGQIEINDENPNEAARWFRRALDAGDHRETCSWLLAKCAEATGDWSEMYGWTSQLTQMEPDDATYHLLHGIAAIHSEKLDEAMSSWRRALELDPEMQAARANIALSLVAQGHKEEAVAEIEEELESGEYDPDFLRVAAIVLQEAGQGDRARQLIDDVVAGADLDTHDLLLAGRVYEQLGETGRSREMYEQVLSLDPNEDEADLAARLLCTLDEPEFEAAFQTVADDVAHRRSAVVLDKLKAWSERYPFYWHVGYLHGIALWQSGQAGEARNVLEAASVQRPDQPEILHTLSHVLLELGETDRAHELAQRAVTLSPHDAGKHSNLAMILAYRRDFAEARSHQERAVKLDPADPLAKLIVPLIARLQEKSAFPLPSGGALPEELIPDEQEIAEALESEAAMRPKRRRRLEVASSTKSGTRPSMSPAFGRATPRSERPPLRVIPRRKPWWERAWDAVVAWFRDTFR